MKRLGSSKNLLLLIVLLLSSAAFAQAVPWLDDPPLAANQPLQTVSPEIAGMPSSAPSTLTIPAGTRVMMVLKSPLHTTSGTAGSGIYLETLYPVIQGNRVVIPARTQVQGVVEANRRPGHVERTSEFRFRFTNLIFCNNYVASIQGALQSIPGARNIRTHDKDGTLKPVDQAEKVVTPAAVGAVGGALLGAHRGFGVGLLPGAGLGAALGLGSVLLKRGDDIHLTPGTQVEMVLQAPLTLEQAQVAENARHPVPPPTFSTANAPQREDQRRKRARTYPPGAMFPGYDGW
jgi:type IV secretion system protein VirB10